MFFLVSREWVLSSIEEPDFGIYLTCFVVGKTNVISKLRIYFTGADLWEHSKLKDGWDPEASRKTKDLGRYPLTELLLWVLMQLFK